LTSHWPQSFIVRVTGQNTGDLRAALDQAMRLLGNGEAALAEEQAVEILKVMPGQANALLILGAARRGQGNAAGALAALRPLAQELPDWAAAQYEVGLAQALAGDDEAAVFALRRAVELKPDWADAWRALGDALYAQGDTAGADAAYAAQIRAATRDPRLLAAAEALCDGRIAVAEHLLRPHLAANPSDVAAIRMLAEVAARLGRYGDAETLLRSALELAPGFDAARHNLATVLHRQNKAEAALAEVEALLGKNPHDAGCRNLKAAILTRIGEYPRAIEMFGGVLEQFPNNAPLWMSYGHALKTAGRQADAVRAYRRSIELAPRLGEAWWSLANLKTVRFEPADLEAMRAQLARTDLSAEDRYHFEFSLGKALEDARDHAASFRHYAEGNRLRRELIHWSAGDNHAHVGRSRAVLTPELFARHAGSGCGARDPIFVVGLPRAGSTLVEQILASHSQVEGTMELPDITMLARELGGRKLRREVSRYPEVLAELTPAQCLELGERYLRQTRIQRKTAAPFFIDKMPNNFLHVGLIHLILPNARIIDARRHPLGCCFSGFKQHFARGQHFSYSLEEIGRYYRDYVDLMAHVDAVLPGRVHRVIYERMVDDTEAEVRRLLEYCGLPFEPACLRFYETERAVRTASSEQVRRPIFRDGVDQWRHYEPWLGPLRNSLGDVLDSYPEAPHSMSKPRTQGAPGVS
jgi:tetratricopeptide (TPR) repeat protein